MIKRKSGKTVYKNPWMEVREDQVIFQNGHEGIYGVVHKDHFALIIPFDGEKFHLVKQYRYAPQTYSIEFPQGKHEDADNSDHQKLAQAELAEELGFTSDAMQKIGFMLEAPGYSDQGFHIYLATNLKSGEKKFDKTEAGLEHIQMTKDELEKAITDGSIVDAPTIAAYGLLKLKNVV
ncbi:MAG: NUDIX hydrolase [bacterium]|nr:NUDIX hydrolase [bacterium]